MTPSLLLDPACPLPPFSAHPLRSGSNAQEASMIPQNWTPAPLSPVPDYSAIIHGDSGAFGGLFPHHLSPFPPWAGTRSRSPGVWQTLVEG